MNRKEIGEIRRRFRRERCNMRAIYGCYVRENQEVISEFKAPMGLMPENEAEKYMTLFKRTLGGTLGKTMHDISFTTRQVASKEGPHGALMALRECALADDKQRKDFYRKVIDSLRLGHDYLILLGCETYDVPFKGKDDEFQDDAGDESFTYVICAICPVKETKSNLHYVHAESTFHDGGMMQAVGSPVVGFLFPAFDERSTNLYGALYYSKDTSDSHNDFVEAVFGVGPQRPADEEKGLFASLLASTLKDECSLDVVNMLHDQVNTRMALHAEAKIPVPLTAGRDEIESMLAGCGVSRGAIDAFGRAFDEEFGAGAEVALQNVIDPKHYTVTAPELVLRISPEKAQDIAVRIIDGVEYIMVPVSDGIAVNDITIVPASN